jgi:hypothetical protein
MGVESRSQRTDAKMATGKGRSVRGVSRGSRFRNRDMLAQFRANGKETKLRGSVWRLHVQGARQVKVDLRGEEREKRKERWRRRVNTERRADETWN